MIRYKRGNLFKEDVEALVNPVNCVGIMGRGLALQFAHMYPDNFKAYVHACRRSEIKPGHSYIYKFIQSKHNPKYIINFPTKRHWRNSSKLYDIDNGLKDLREIISLYKIKSIVLPALGCGLGLLKWGDVKSLIEKYLGDFLDVNIIVYKPINRLAYFKLSSRRK